MILSRKEGWGILKYDTKNHDFILLENEYKGIMPYLVRNPVVLNIDLTVDCNMDCDHCVAKDLELYGVRDLELSQKLTSWINESPFLVIVITGGEPLLPEKEKLLLSLLNSIKKKGIIIDTNGTIKPSGKILKKIKEKNALLRISQDSVRPQDEIYFRKVSRNKNLNFSAFFKKIQFTQWFKSKGINVAIQSLLYKSNAKSILDMPQYLFDKSIKKWYIQRMILSYRATDKKFLLRDRDYLTILEKLEKKCERLGIECYAKLDKRHNCVYLLTGAGDIYTQGDGPREKILLANISSDFNYFNYVSGAEHAVRYYGPYWEQIVNWEGGK